MLNVSKCRFGDALLDLLFFAAAIAPAIIILGPQDAWSAKSMIQIHSDSKQCVSCQMDSGYLGNGHFDHGVLGEPISTPSHIGLGIIVMPGFTLMKGPSLVKYTSEYKTRVIGGIPQLMVIRIPWLYVRSCSNLCHVSLQLKHPCHPSSAYSCSMAACSMTCTAACSCRSCRSCHPMYPETFPCQKTCLGTCRMTYRTACQSCLLTFQETFPCQKTCLGTCRKTYRTACQSCLLTFQETFPCRKTCLGTCRMTYRTACRLTFLRTFQETFPCQKTCLGTCRMTYRTACRLTFLRTCSCPSWAFDPSSGPCCPYLRLQQEFRQTGFAVAATTAFKEHVATWCQAHPSLHAPRPIRHTTCNVGTWRLRLVWRLVKWKLPKKWLVKPW